MLSERQKTAEKLMHWLHKLGAFVVSPMPLPADQKLRFQVLSPEESVLEKLRAEGWEPMLINHGLRFHRDTAMPCGTYEIYLEPERQQVLDDRTIRGEIVDPAKKAAQAAAVEAMRKSIYGKR